MKVAIVGCLHGKLDRVYRMVNKIQLKNGYLIDLVIICGDLQAVRGPNDLKCLSAPDKHLGDFHQYYRGRKYASHLTLVVGGDREASNYLQTLPYGGWIARNIYYMGYSNVVKVNGVRIGGISGIYNQISANKGHHESLPYDNLTIESVCHTRSIEAFRLLQLNERLDMMISHDWPRLMYERPVAKAALLAKRPDLKEAIENEQLGSPLFDILVRKLKPRSWFAAHLHVHFRKVYTHRKVPKRPGKKIKRTDFLALDKWTPRNATAYLEVVDIRNDEFNVTGLEYDPEWLAILKYSDKWTTTQEYPEHTPVAPFPSRIEIERSIIHKKLNGNYKVPENFQMDLPYTLAGMSDMDPRREQNYTNSQTTSFCAWLGISDPMKQMVDRLAGITHNPDAIELSSESEHSSQKSPPERMPSRILSKVTCVSRQRTAGEISKTIETAETSKAADQKPQTSETPKTTGTAMNPETDVNPETTETSENLKTTVTDANRPPETAAIALGSDVNLAAAKGAQQASKTVEVVEIESDAESSIVEIKLGINPPTVTDANRPPETAAIAFWSGVNLAAARKALRAREAVEVVEIESDDSEPNPPKRKKV